MANKVPNKMRTMPLVSIGIPTYNRSESLRVAIESAIAQDYSNTEIIICDNASTDATSRVCAEYEAKYKNIKYHKSPRNNGPMRNFQNVLEQSGGEYFMWLADDDHLDPNYISTCLRALLDDGNLIIAGGRAAFFGGELNKYGKTFSIQGASPFVRIPSYYWSPMDNSIFYGLMRSGIAKKNSLHSSIAGDWEFVAGMLAHGGAVTLKDAVIHRRSGGASSSLHGIVAILGLSRINSYFPGASIAISSSIDILWRNNVYSDIALQQRIALALLVFFTNLAKHGLYRTIRVMQYKIAVAVIGDVNYEKLKAKIKSRLAS